MNQWLKDFRWALNVMRAHRLRRTLIFSKRQVFDRHLPLAQGIAYPDFFYSMTMDDIARAYREAVFHTYPKKPMQRPTPAEPRGDWMS